MKVLFVEDGRGVQLRYQQLIKGLALKIESLWADNIDDGVAMVRANPDIAIIVLDGDLGGRSGSELIGAVRSEFKGKIIAASGSRYVCRDLLGAGANFSCDGDKEQVGRLLAEINEKLLEILVAIREAAPVLNGAPS